MRAWIRRMLAGCVGLVAQAAAPHAWAEALTLAPQPDGALELRAGATTVARVPVATPALRRGPARLREVEVEGHRLADVSVPVRGTGHEERWVGELRPRDVRVVWKGLVGPRDADGESAIGLDVSADGVVEYQTAAHVTRCDGVPVRLFPRAYDFDEGRFRAVVSDLPASGGQKLVARRGDAQMPKGRPIEAFHFTAASTTPGAGADARALTAPAALDDGDPATAWAEGLGGDGRGEFLTARSAVPGAALRGVRIIPGDASSAARFRARNRVRRFQLALGPRAEDRFDVELAEDPAADAARFREPYWVALPRPVISPCATIVITDVAPGADASPPRSFGDTAIAELTLFTNLDGPDGAERLVADVARAADCAARVPALVGLGAGAVPPIVKALETAKRGAPRECLVEALTRIEPAPRSPGVASALVSALAGASEKEARLISAALRRAEPPPVEALAAVVDREAAPVDDRVTAARVLGALEAPTAPVALLASAGRGPAALRAAIVQALGGSPALDATALLEALARAKGEAPTREADLVRVVPAAVKRAPSVERAARAALGEALAPERPFEVRGRAVAALGALGPPSVPALADVRTRSDEPVLRHLAARELGTLGGADAVVALRAALADGDPRVRETAAQGLGHNVDRAAEPALAAGAKQEPWPFVRRAELEALGRLCGPGTGDLLARAVERDVDDVRRAALVGLVRCKDPRARTLLMRTLGRRNEASTLRELAAALLGELGDPTVAPELAAALARQVNESEADLSVEGVAAASLRALARLGGPEATKAAVALATDTRHPFQHAAVEALGVLCDPTAGAATLRTLEAGKDSGLAAAAQNAQKRCASR
jgi:HEAT repeat protein